MALVAAVLGRERAALAQPMGTQWLEAGTLTPLNTNKTLLDQQIGSVHSLIDRLKV